MLKRSQTLCTIFSQYHTNFLDKAKQAFHFERDWVCIALPKREHFEEMDAIQGEYFDGQTGLEMEYF